MVLTQYCSEGQYHPAERGNILAVDAIWLGGNSDEKITGTLTGIHRLRAVTQLDRRWNRFRLDLLYFDWHRFGLEHVHAGAEQDNSLGARSGDG